MTNATIVRADSSDTAWIADLIGSEFQQLGVSAWLVPDPAQRGQTLARNFEIFVDYALTHGEVQVTHDRAAASVWLRRGVAELPPPDDYERRVAEACGDATDRFFELDTLFDTHHPGEPHHHLAFLAVRHDRQRAGLGSAMLSHYHQMLDEQGISAFLEASSTGSRELYRRHGYEPLGDPYAVPNGALFHPMWRKPA